ncbi:amino acid adenylation domain-containing protein [Desulfosporosinus sp. FKA]|uniref:amino acid adenylation domain-containing protein n=1 Tax=Desulfosporosinus sp. FKA TaxID=1969834 RepID=UPI000B49F937|nr:amino acid adenylation domain-containing protein [Desulfosporosinus sp. FKA]
MQINVIEYLEMGPLIDCQNKIAVIDGTRQLTFKELETSSKKLASVVINKFNLIKSPIAVFLPKGYKTIIANLGIIYSGNIYTNLDIKSPNERIKNIIKNIEPVLIITSKELEPTLLSLGIEPSRIIDIDTSLQDGSDYSNQLILDRVSSIIDTDPLCIINTSGSTGTPKGVVINHRSVIDFIDQAVDSLQLDGTEIIGSLSPFYFDIYTLELYLSLAKGATIVIIPDQLAVFPVKLVEFLVKQSVSFIFWVPTIMVTIANFDLLANCDLSCIKKALFAGEVFSTKHFNYWRRNIPNAMFVNLYGPIEITVDCLYYIVERDFNDEEPLPIGYVFKNTDILILNENNERAKVNEQGEICVRGGSLAMGYWNDAEKTARAFVQNPLNKYYPEIIYRTGDLGLINEHGEIMFRGRKDYQIKHLGYRIELPEIEHIILGIETIKNACVLYNKEKKEITLFYESNQEVPPALIREEVAKLLPKYMLPTVYYHLESMPRNPNGKIDRQRLTERLFQS